MNVTSMPTAFISGGSSGIGLGLAKRLLGDGYAVTVSGRREAKLAEATACLAEMGPVFSVQMSAASDQSLVAGMDAHRRRFGSLDVLINNAGVGAAEAVGDLSAKAVDLQLDVNLRSHIMLTVLALPLLRKSSRAHIVNISSIAGLRGEGGLSVYSASKAGLVGFTESLQEELGAEGIKATAVCPGFVDTPMADWIRETVGSHSLISVADVVDVVTTVINLSPACNVPVVALEPPSRQFANWNAQSAIDLAKDATTLSKHTS